MTANIEIAPDGTLSAEKVIENTTNVERNVRQTINVVSGQQYTASCYFKAAERTFARIACFGNVSGAVGGVVGAGFNLSTGTLASDSGAPNATSIQNVGNGWYRCRITVTANATGTITFNLGPSLAINTFNSLGDGVSGGYIWGAQVS